MKEKIVTYLDFSVDRLTRSIENAVTGDSFATEVTHFLKSDLAQISRAKGWQFDWNRELSYNDREVYKLTIVDNPTVIQGLMSLRVESDHIYMPLIESAPFNKGKTKMYVGVPGNLIAFACRLSFQRGYEDFVSFHSKTRLIEYYKRSLGAYHIGESLMIINTEAAKSLIERYFKS